MEGEELGGVEWSGVEDAGGGGSVVFSRLFDGGKEGI